MRLHELTALELGAKIRDGEVTATQAVRGALERIETRDGAERAFITVCGDLAERQAVWAEGAGLLYGVPMALKDNICTKGVRTTCASRMLEDFIPPYDATVVRRLYDQGAVLLGKLNMDEFAMGSTSETSCFGAVKNPWDHGRSPGGSSGGSAAAVAAGECWYALGSDTGGSVRQPAAHCGVTGIKPTYGAVSRYGLVAYASSLDQIGPIARSAADCAAVLDAIMGRDPRDATSAERSGGLLAGLTGDVRGLRLGIPGTYFSGRLQPAVGRAVLEAAEALRARGAGVEWFTLPLDEFLVPAYYIIASAEASSNLARFDGVRYGLREPGDGTLASLYRATRDQGFGDEVKRRILMGTYVLSSDQYERYYQKAVQVKEQVAGHYRAAFEKFDLLLLPTASTTAPKLAGGLQDPLEMYRGDACTVGANLAGLPALSMPCGFDEAGLPIGAQLVGPPMGEGTVLAAAHAFQQDTDYHRRHPWDREGEA